MTEEDAPLRQLVWRTVNEYIRYPKRWLTACFVIFLVSAGYFRLSNPELDVGRVIIISVISSIGIPVGAAIGYLLVRSLKTRIWEIIEEIATPGAAIARKAKFTVVLIMIVIIAVLFIDGDSIQEFLVAGLLLIGVLLVSDELFKGIMATRDLSEEERSACGAAVDQDAEFRTIIGRFGDTVNGFAIGVLPSHKLVLIPQKAFDRFDNEQIEAFAAHELGHIVENHSTVYVIRTAIFLLLIFLLVRALYWGQWRVLALTVSIGLVSLALEAKINRYLEFRADVFAVNFLGDSEQVIRWLHALKQHDEDGSSGVVTRIGRRIVPKPLLRGRDRLFASHPPMKQRIKHIERSENNVDTSISHD